MNDSRCYYLDNYPLGKHYAACEEYLYNKIDWHAKSQEIEERGVIFFDVSDVISLFPHLELDENYELICYLSSEYHGIWGRVTAIESGADKTPTFDPANDRLSRLFLGMHFELPKSAAPPMEAIYNDGTPEGYFEAVLCSLFLQALPYTHFECKNWDKLESAPPADFDKDWTIRVGISDWRPRAVSEWNSCTILVFRREIENGIGSSDGRDRICLTQYSFQSGLGFYHAFAEKDKHSMYQGRIDNDKRYTDKRRCCVSVNSSIMIADEKKYTAKI